MTFLSDRIVELLYGAQYNQAGSVLMIHIWAGVFVFLGVASSNWFLVENLKMLSLQKAFYGMITNIILNLILIPKYGIQGAAFATLVSQATATYITDFFQIKTRKIFYMKSKTIFLISILRKVN
jgi:O-antigen/teichoic acid export membrane protein